MQLHTETLGASNATHYLETKSFRPRNRLRTLRLQTCSRLRFLCLQTCRKSTHIMTTTLLAAASNDKDEEEEETCPVCYEPNPHPPAAGDTPTSVACEVCKHAVCGECDSMLTQTGHVQCPMCRAPRRPRALPLSMCQKCPVFAVP